MRDNAGVSASDFHAGRLLVARPSMLDPNFEHSVVLLLDHDADGALGVVLNRPTEVSVSEVLPGWSALVSAPPVVFRGGPVATDSALGVAEVAGEDEPLGFRTMFTRADGAAQPVNVPASAPAPAAAGARRGRTGLIDLDTPTELLSGALTSLRIFAGYAGWAAGQLEHELADGGWALVDSLDTDLQVAEAATLWRRVLRRQGGKLALLSTFRGDPGLN